MLVVHVLFSTVLSAWYDGVSLPSWLAAFILGYLLLKVLGMAVSRCRLYAQRVEAGACFVPWFVWNMVVASLDVAVIVINPQRRISPAVVQVSVQTDDRRLVTLIACLLTLTPGTLALSYRTGVLFVHVLDATAVAPVQQAVSEIERRLMAWVYPSGGDDEG